jgi:hypothetical protein
MQYFVHHHGRSKLCTCGACRKSFQRDANSVPQFGIALAMAINYIFQPAALGNTGGLPVQHIVAVATPRRHGVFQSWSRQLSLASASSSALPAKSLLNIDSCKSALLKTSPATAKFLLSITMLSGPPTAARHLTTKSSPQTSSTV